MVHSRPLWVAEIEQEIPPFRERYGVTADESVSTEQPAVENVLSIISKDYTSGIDEGAYSSSMVMRFEALPLTLQRGLFVLTIILTLRSPESASTSSN